jgi:hypothetical protein
MSKEANEISEFQKLLEDINDEDESPEEEAEEDAEMKKGTKKATEKEVIDFLKEHPNPDDDEVHDWALENEFEIHALEKLFYKLASDLVNKKED